MATNRTTTGVNDRMPPTFDPQFGKPITASATTIEATAMLRRPGHPTREAMKAARMLQAAPKDPSA